MDSAFKSRPWLQGVLVAPIMLAVLYLRIPEQFHNPQLVLEGGTYLYTEALNEGLKSLFIPIHGYLYLFPRIASLILVEFPPDYMPLLYTLVAFLFPTGIALYLLSSACSLRYKLLCAMLMVIGPLDNYVQLNLAFVQWYIMLWFSLVLLEEQSHTLNGSRVFSFVLFFLFGLTGPASLIFAPLFIVAWRISGSRRTMLYGAILSATAAIQLWFLYETRGIFAPQGKITNPISTDSIGGEWLEALSRIFGRAVYHSIPGSSYHSHLTLGATGLLLLIIIYYAVNEKRWASLLSLFGALLVGTSGIVRYWGEPAILSGQSGRYAFVVTLVMLWLLLDVSRRGRTHTILIAVFLTISIPGLYYSFRLETIPDYQWAEQNDCIGGPEACDIKIPGGWVRYKPRP